MNPAAEAGLGARGLRPGASRSDLLLSPAQLAFLPCPQAPPEPRRAPGGCEGAPREGSAAPRSRSPAPGRGDARTAAAEGSPQLLSLGPVCPVLGVAGVGTEPRRPDALPGPPRRWARAIGASHRSKRQAGRISGGNPFVEEKAEPQLGNILPRSHQRAFSAAQRLPAPSHAGGARERGRSPPCHLKEGIWLAEITFLCNQPAPNTSRVTSRRSFPRSSLSSVAYIIYLLNILLFRCAERETVIKNCASILLVITRGAGRGRGACGGSSYVSQTRA